MKLSEIVTDKKRRRHSVWVVSAPFRALPYISDPRYLPGNEESRGRRRLSRRKVNVAFKSAASKSRAEHRKQEVLHVITLRIVNVGEELLVHSGMKYLI